MPPKVSSAHVLRHAGAQVVEHSGCGTGVTTGRSHISGHEMVRHQHWLAAPGEACCNSATIDSLLNPAHAMQRKVAACGTSIAPQYFCNSNCYRRPRHADDRERHTRVNPDDGARQEASAKRSAGNAAWPQTTKGSDMKLRHLLFAAALVATATQARAQGFSDTSIGVRDSLFVANPGGNTDAVTLNDNEKGSRDVNKVIVNVGHFDAWDYGTNFFNVDILMSNPNEAAMNSAGGSTELYGVYRAQLSPDKIFGLNTKFGPIKAINFEIGGDLETENSTFAPDKKLFVVGPNFNIGLPAGFLNIGVHMSKEWNHNGIAGALITDGVPGPFHSSVSFHPTPEFEFVWLYNLTALTGLPLDFKGFTNVVLPKGNTGFGGPTYTEVLSVPELSLDIGSLLFHKAHKPDLYLAVELWSHKFGNSNRLAGTEEVSPEFGIEMHF
jgi:nucleoside-specific outer membrane channel protein Tsx